jgi:hypothetical protein
LSMRRGAFDQKDDSSDVATAARQHFKHWLLFSNCFLSYSKSRDDDAMREFMSVRASVLEEQKKMKKAAVASPLSTESAPSLAAEAPWTPLNLDQINRVEAATKFPSLVLDLDYMQRLNFPGTAGALPDGQAWAASPGDGGDSKLARQVVAIDCEMVITSGGAQELARLTAVDELGSVLLDMLVVPELPVANYNTQFSGITKELLKGVC